MIPPHAIATPESIKSCASCVWCWEEPPQLENRLDGQPKGTGLYCRLLRDTSTCPGPTDKIIGGCYDGQFWAGEER